MSAMNILDLLRLKSAPWLSLIFSVVAWFVLWAILHNMTVTSAVGDFLLALGLPFSVDRGAMAVHAWLVTEPRVTWASWGAVTLAVAVGIRYFRAVFNEREAQFELMNAGRRVSRTKTRPVDGLMRYETDEMYTQAMERAQADYSKAVKYDRELQSFEQGSQLRCAAVYWLIAGIVVELKDGALPDLIVGGVAMTLTTVLIILVVLTLIAVLIACAMQEFYDASEDPTTADRIKDTFENFVWEVLFLVVRLTLILFALPLFVLGILLYPPPSMKGDAAP